MANIIANIIAKNPSSILLVFGGFGWLLNISGAGWLLAFGIMLNLVWLIPRFL